MTKTYRHLNLNERITIQMHLSEGTSIRTIAHHLQRSPSSVSRELHRCGWKGKPAKGVRAVRPNCSDAAGIQGYSCSKAQERAQALACKPRFERKLLPGNATFELVRKGLARGLSPRQCCLTLSCMPEVIRLSHETIYTALYLLPRGELRAEVLALLRQSRAKRRPRSRGEERSRRIIDMTSIEERPLDVLERLVPGHWEGDLIKGAFNRSQVGTLVERKTLFTVLARVPRATAACTANSFIGVLKRIDAQQRLSLTYDQGSEMADHAHLARQLNMKVFFAHPHSPWERGRNENTNGLLRQYLPKGTDLSGHSQEALDAIAWQLNVRPRVSLGGKCPAELFLPEGSFNFQTYWAKELGLDH
jgi:transposase, IS30 family